MTTLSDLTSSKVDELSGCHDLRAIFAGETPVIIRNCIAHWPLVLNGKRSFSALAQYLAAFDKGATFQAMIAPPYEKGRLFYAPDMHGFNFKRMQGYLGDALEIWESHLDNDEGPTFYIGSHPIKDYLPGLQLENTLDFLKGIVEPNIWMGNAVTIAIHNDDSENIACVAAGRRRFTLFPPDQEANLYIGPDDLTPAGRPISLVDLKAPDYAKYPRFRVALEHAQVAVLEAGDALYIPTHWWHNVESLESMNILVNFWWKGQPPRL
jgi:hypothetical protein